MKTKLQAKTAQWLNKYRFSIDLDPFFQRGTVWSPKKQQHFIDTIFKGWGTPKIFLHQTGKDQYECLDGKQRLTSLIKFMANEVALDGSKTIGYGGKKYEDLPVSIQDKIDRYKFSVEIVTRAGTDEVADLYQRLQGGTPLNFGEKAFAYPGKMNEFVKHRLSTKAFFKKTVALSDNRYSHYAVCAQIALLSIKGATEDLKLKKIEKFFIEYAAFNDKNSDAEKILSIIHSLEKAFPNEREVALKNRANIVSIFYLFLDLTSRGNMAGKEKEIGSFFKKFVKDLQKEFEKEPDVRDAALISYQSAVTQGADKIKSIKIRHGILLKRIALKNKFFRELLNPPTASPIDYFRFLFDSKLQLLGLKKVHEFDTWLIKNKGLKSNKCKKRTGETVVGHVRNCIYHTEHGSYTSQSLLRATKILEKI